MPPPAKKARFNSFTCSCHPLQDSIASQKFIPSPPCDPGLPEPILNYLKKNAPPKLLLKLMQVSKYFKYKEFPYAVTDMIVSISEVVQGSPIGSRLKCLQDIPSIDIDDLQKPLWLTGSLHCTSSCGRNIASIILENAVVCDIQHVVLFDQDLTFEELKACASSKKVQYCHLDACIIEDKNENVIPLEEIIKLFPLIKTFIWSFDHILEDALTEDSTKNIIQNLNAKTLTHCSLYNVPDTFDFDHFVSFMNANLSICFVLSFSYNISDEYATKLQAYVDQLVESGAYLKHNILVTFPHENEKHRTILMNHIFYLLKSM